jgi:hypothetical protein
VNLFVHENSGQCKEVFLGIVNDTQVVEYTLLKGRKVGVGHELSGVGVTSRYLQ